MFALALVLALAPPAATPQSDAERLFEEGRAALKADQVDLACEAFQQSHRLQPALGVLLNLASCLEKQGKLSSAWVRFNEAITWAARTHEGEREQFAREHAASLKPRVSWLSVTVARDVEVTIDDAAPTTLTPSSPTAVPVDLGSHQVVARAAGFEPWTRVVSVTTVGATVTVAVPALKPTAVATTGLPPPRPALVLVHPSPSRAPGVALLVAGGVAMLAGGVGLGWSLSTYDRLQGQRAPVLESEIRVSRSTFEQLQWIYPASWAVLGVGAAAAITGAVLTARGASVPRVTPVVGPGGAGVVVWGSFD